MGVPEGGGMGTLFCPQKHPHPGALMSRAVLDSAGDTVVTAPAFPVGLAVHGGTDLPLDSDSWSAGGWDRTPVGGGVRRGAHGSPQAETCPSRRQKTWGPRPASEQPRD